MHRLTWPELFLLCSLGLMAGGLAITFVPLTRVGRGGGTASFDGHPTAYWRQRIRAWREETQQLPPGIVSRRAVPPGIVSRRDPRAVPVLVELLRDPDSRTRLAAIEALGAIGPSAREAVPALRRACEDRVTDTAARNALRQIEPPRVDGASHDGP